MSTVIRARSGTTFTRPGLMSKTPTFATCGGPNRSAISRAATAMRAATMPASRRIAIGVVPAWLVWPRTVYSVQEIPCTPVTAPIGMPSASSTGPCSTCSSR